IEGEGSNARLVARASIGFGQDYLDRHRDLPMTDVAMTRILESDFVFMRFQDELDPAARRRLMEYGLNEVVAVKLPGTERPLGVISVASTQTVKFQRDEIAYFMNLANLVGLTLQNVRLFEQVASAQQQWVYTFDSIGDPILVHDRSFKILRSNQRLSHLLGR